MAGHSKWNNIKRRKAGQDAKRAKVFTKIIRELTVAAQEGGGVIEDNPALRVVIDKAKATGMPKDTMERAIARGAGGQAGMDLTRLTYEGYGPGGVAVLVETMTDNRNRTVAEIRHAFTKAGGNLGTDGSVAYLFDKKGQIQLEPGVNEDEVMETAIEAGAEDVMTDDEGNIEIITKPEDYLRVKDALAAAGLEPATAEVAMIARACSDLDTETAEKVLYLIDLLEGIEDVTNVFVNASFPNDLTSGEQT